MDRLYFQAYIAALEALWRSGRLCDSIAAVALAFRNLGFGRPPLVGRERTALINRLAKGSICLAPDVTLVSLDVAQSIRVCSLLSFSLSLSTLLLFKGDSLLDESENCSSLKLAHLPPSMWTRTSRSRMSQQCGE